jgi:hypothetical protein
MTLIMLATQATTWNHTQTSLSQIIITSNYIMKYSTQKQWLGKRDAMRPNGFASRNPIKGGEYASECIFKIKLSIFEMILKSSVKNWTNWDGHVLCHHSLKKMFYVITHVRNFWLHNNSKISFSISDTTCHIGIEPWNSRTIKI